LANTENAVYFYTSKDLSFWQPSRAPWKLEAAELVSPGPETNERAPLVSDLVVADDFHLTLQFHVGKDGRGAIQIRGENTPDISPVGLRAELAAGMPIAVVDGNGKRLPPAQAATIRPDAWNKLEIVVVQNRFQKVLLNGQEVSSAHDLPAPARAVISLEGPSASGREIRFRLLDLRMLPAKKLVSSLPTLTGFRMPAIIA
jgi:Domain of Unknown Function (DUF1080)